MKRLLFALALVIATAVPVPAAAAGCDGVTVIVDFRGLGGGVQQRCAPGSPSSGIEALTTAHFGYTYASRQPGFVCRIDNLPSADADKCVNASPSSAYWSYWHASPGGSWSYSNQGAATYVPPRGSVEGWAFGAGEQPGMAPPAAPAPQPKPPAPQPPQPQVPAPVNPPAGQPQPTAPRQTTTSVPPSSSAPTSSQAPSAEASSTSPSNSAVISQEPSRDKAEEKVEAKAKTGWLWTAAGVLVIAALVVAGLLVARRRRGAEED